MNPSVSGKISIPRSVLPTSNWTMHIWFESNIETIDFTVINGAVVMQKNRN